MRNLALLLCVSALPAFGQGLGVNDSADDHVQASLHLEHATTAPGSSTTLAVRFALSEAWHLYWTNPGDSGDAPAVELSLPKGVTAGPIEWPLPTRHVLPGDLLAQIYEGELVLLIPLNVGADAALGSHPIRASLEWLVCKEVCLMGDASLEGQIALGETKPNAESKPLFARARARLPRAPKPGEVTSSWNGRSLTLKVAGATELVFFAESKPALAEPITSGVAKGDTLVLRYPELSPKASVRGLLRATVNGKFIGLRVAFDAPAALD